MNYSLTQGGNLTALAGLTVLILKNVFQFEVATDEVSQIIIAMGIVLSWVGRYRKGDITLGGFRK